MPGELVHFERVYDYMVNLLTGSGVPFFYIIMHYHSQMSS